MAVMHQALNRDKITNKNLFHKEETYKKSKIPATPKSHRESPQVGVDGFEPPTLCL